VVALAVGEWAAWHIYYKSAWGAPGDRRLKSADLDSQGAARAARVTLDCNMLIYAQECNDEARRARPGGDWPLVAADVVICPKEEHLFLRCFSPA
jgi:hypothetical protein